MPSCLDSDVDVGTFHETSVSIMVTDVVVSGYQQQWHSLSDKVIVFHGEGFQLPATSQCGEMI